MENSILVTGASGSVGREVVQLLTESHCPLLAATRDPERFQQIFGDGINCAPFDFVEPITFSVLEKVNTVFLIRPVDVANVRKYLFPFIEAAKEYAIKRIVFLSVLGAEDNRFTPYFKLEKYIENSGIPYTILRSGFFMQDLVSTCLADIKERNEIYLPAHKGKSGFIDIRDLAEVVVKVLQTGEFSHQALNLTGVEVLSYYEVADLLTQVLGREIKYLAPSVPNFITRMQQQGVPMVRIMALVGLYSLAKLEESQASSECQRLLGREPISLREFIEEYYEKLV